MDEANLARLHEEQHRWDRQQRWWITWSERALDPRRRLANRMQEFVREILEGRGYVVTGTRHKERFDLLVQGVRVEVKASRGDGERYQFNLHGNEADVLVIGCVNHQVHFFVIPFAEVAGLRMVEITRGDPLDYVGKWTRYYGAWEIVDELVAAGWNVWQPSLMEV